MGVPPQTEAAPCEWCGHFHGPRCPLVKAMEFERGPDGERLLRRVEFLTPLDVPQVRAGTDAPGTSANDYPRYGGN